MSGTTRQIRAMGRIDSLEGVLAEEFNHAIDDLEFIRAAVNTANGGAISISASSLIAAKVSFLGG